VEDIMAYWENDNPGTFEINDRQAKRSKRIMDRILEKERKKEKRRLERKRREIRRIARHVNDPDLYGL
jgi:hypothetical protein